MIPITDDVKRILSTMREIVREELMPIEPQFLRDGFFAVESLLKEKGGKDV